MTLIEMIGLLGVGLTILGLIVKNAIGIAATETKATAAHQTALKSLEDFNDYRVHAAAEFATHAHLRAVEDRLTAALNQFGSSMERHTARLDTILQSLAEKAKDQR